ncbi:MAG TPA: aldo/keto reductase [Steroidobacteraceae bacterium]|nr:aldo/keto reductase [Steroidobacteraceae bacterium]
MDRRNFLAMSGVAAMAGSGASLSQDGAKPAAKGGAGTGPASAPGKLLTRRIPSSGESIPAIGLGTSGPFEVGTGEHDRAPLREVLRAFFAAGATLIDTSPMYSTAESVLGDLLTADEQQRAFIATKVWTPNSGAHGAQKGIEQMQRSMSLLKHPRIELMQVHNLVDLDAHLKTLRAWKAEGKIRYIGVTHYTTSSYPDLMSIIQREKPDFVQFNYSVGTREAEQRLLPMCADKGAPC